MNVLIIPNIIIFFVISIKSSSQSSQVPLFIGYPHILPNKSLLIFAGTTGEGRMFNENMQMIKKSSTYPNFDFRSTFITVKNRDDTFLMANGTNAELILFTESKTISVKKQNVFSDLYRYHLSYLSNGDILFGFCHNDQFLFQTITITPNQDNIYVHETYKFITGIGKSVDCIEVSYLKALCFLNVQNSLNYFFLELSKNTTIVHKYIKDIGGNGLIKILKINQQKLILCFYDIMSINTHTLGFIRYGIINVQSLNNSISYNIFSTNLSTCNNNDKMDFILLNNTSFISACYHHSQIDFGLQDIVSHTTKQYSLKFENVNYLKLSFFGTKPAIFFSTQINSYYHLLLEPQCLSSNISLFMNSQMEVTFKNLIKKGLFNDDTSKIYLFFPTLPQEGRLLLKSNNNPIDIDKFYDNEIIYESEKNPGDFSFTYAGVIENRVGEYCNFNIEVKKCHDSCFSCENETSTSCYKCAVGYYPFEGETPPFSCHNEKTKQKNWYLDKINQMYKKCYQTCSECDKGGDINNNNCINCNNGYYFIENEKRNCVQNPKGFYLDAKTDLYKKCYKTCASCSGAGIETHNSCTSCIIGTQLNGENCECEKNKCFYQDTCVEYKDKYEKRGSVCVNCANENQYLIIGEQKCTIYKPEMGYELYDASYNLYIKCPNLWYINNNGEYKCATEDNCQSIKNIERQIYERTSKQCVKNCLPFQPDSACKRCSMIPLYEYGGECIEKCPKKYKENDTISKCEPYAPIEELQSCKDQSCMSKARDSMGLVMKEYTNNTIVIRGDNFTMEIYGTKDPYNGSQNTSKLDLGNCENLLKEYYNLSKDENLIIAKVDLNYPNKVTVQVEYKIYDSKGRELDLSICQDVPINISTPLNSNVNINIDKAKELSEQGYDIYDPENDFFNDVCIPYSTNGKDVTLKDRRTVLYQNVSFCEEGCLYKGINFEINRVDCECQVKNVNRPYKNSTSNSTKDFVSNVFNINFDILKCYHLLLFWNNIYSNIGLLSIALIVITQISCLVVCLIKEITLWRSKVNSLLKGAPPTFDKIPTIDLVTQDEKQSEKGLIQAEDIFSDKSLKTNFNKDKEIELYKVNLKIPTLFQTLEDVPSAIPTEKVIETEIKEEHNKLFFIHKNDIDNYPFHIAIKKDKRNLCQMFLKTFQEKQLFLRAFFFKSKYELLSVNLSLFLSDLALYFVLNSMFYTNNQISSRYRGELNYIHNILRSVYSWAIGALCFAILNYSFSFAPVLDVVAYEVKDRKNLMRLMSNATKIIHKKLIIFFFVEFVFALAFLYYVSIFCIVYHSTQINWFIGSVTSFGISLIVSFGISLAIAVLRITGLKCNSVYVYNLSLHINYIL